MTPKGTRQLGCCSGNPASFVFGEPPETQLHCTGGNPQIRCLPQAQSHRVTKRSLTLPGGCQLGFSVFRGTSGVVSWGLKQCATATCWGLCHTAQGFRWGQPFRTQDH